MTTQPQPKPTPRSPTTINLAAALDVGERTLFRYKARGLPLPREGESLAAWAHRAHAWIADNRRVALQSRHGDPADPTSQAYWNLNHKKARAMREMLALQVARGELHALGPCHRDTVTHLGALREHFARLPIELARTCENKPADFVRDVVERAIAAAFAQIVAAAEAMHNETAATTGDTSSPGAAADTRPRTTT